MSTCKSLPYKRQLCTKVNSSNKTTVCTSYDNLSIHKRERYWSQIIKTKANALQALFVKKPASLIQRINVVIAFSIVGFVMHIAFKSELRP